MNSNTRGRRFTETETDPVKDLSKVKSQKYVLSLDLKASMETDCLMSAGRLFQRKGHERKKHAVT